MGEVRDQHYLKGLQTRRERLRGELQSIKIEKQDLGKRFDDLTNKLKQVEAEIKTLSEEPAEILVTEHAMLRYFEKVLGYDLDDIRRKILPTAVESQINVFGSGKFPVNGSHKLVVKQKRIVSVLGPNEN